MALDFRQTSSRRLGPVPRGNTTATGCMLVVVAFFGLVPMVIAIGDSYNPFLFGAAMRLGIALLCLTVLCLFYWPELRHEKTMPFIRERLFSPEMAGILFSYFDFAILALSLRWIDASIGAVIYELWPIVLIFIVARWTGGEYRNLDSKMMLMLLIAFAGVVLVLASQNGGFVALKTGFWGVSDTSVYLGVGFALLAAFITAFTGFSWVWSHNSINDERLPFHLKSERTEESLGVFFLLVALVVTNSLAFVINGSIGLVFGAITGEWITLNGLLIGIVGGVFSYGVASVLWRVATNLTSDIGIHAMSYFTPIFALIFLALVDRVGDVEISFLIMGAAAIITSNLLISFEAEIRWGLKSLLISLWLFGTIAYLRDDISQAVGVSEWYWQAGGYFQAIALAATVFTLLLAFRVARFVTRTNNEDTRTFALFRRMEILVRRKVLDPGVLECIKDIDRSAGDLKAAEAAYERAREYVEDALKGAETLSDVDLQFLNQGEADLDGLARSKQTDIVLGEVFALGIFAFIIISLALFTRPSEVKDWTRLMVDVFAMLISAVIVFLVVDVRDLHRERAEEKFTTAGVDGQYRIVFRDTERRLPDQLISALVGAMLIVTFLVLLMNKWVGWFPWLG